MSFNDLTHVTKALIFLSVTNYSINVKISSVNKWEIR